MENSKLLALLAECAAACHMCSTACLNEPDVQHMSNCIRLDLDCAQICSTTAAFVARHSTYAKPLLNVCAELCATCAEECGKHEVRHCRECAAACRACAEACKAAA